MGNILGGIAILDSVVVLMGCDSTLASSQGLGLLGFTLCTGVGPLGSRGSMLPLGPHPFLHGGLAMMGYQIPTSELVRHFQRTSKELLWRVSNPEKRDLCQECMGKKLVDYGTDGTGACWDGQQCETCAGEGYIWHWHQH
jgi:hypothetical protein